MGKKLLSVVIPAYNEGENVAELYNELKLTCLNLIKNKTISDYEVIFVNDGSRDRTELILEELKKTEKERLKIIQLRRNFGQTAALRAGFDFAKGDLIVTMDSDLQNDPADIPRLIEKLNLGYDVVSGWRRRRKDKFTKRFFSKIMNNLRRELIGDNLHDYGCSLKIYKRECIKDLELFGELHRYITAYLYIKGYRIGEIEVNHRPRKAGITKYKFNRGLNGLLDLFFLKFWSSFSSRPLHFYGRLGVYQWILAVLIIIEQIIKAFVIQRLTLGPLLALSAMFAVTGLIFIMFGFLFEVCARTYFRQEKTYNIKKTL